MMGAVLAAALAPLAISALHGHACAQAVYPDRPLRLVIAFGPGGVGDTTSRLVAEKLGDKLGQRVIVENNPGGGGIAAARSPTATRWRCSPTARRSASA
jgi:tripartite-type tricarboxylate transporter receptor subunit TctC